MAAKKTPQTSNLIAEQVKLVKSVETTLKQVDKVKDFLEQANVDITLGLKIEEEKYQEYLQDLEDKKKLKVEEYNEYVNKSKKEAEILTEDIVKAIKEERDGYIESYLGTQGKTVLSSKEHTKLLDLATNYEKEVYQAVNDKLSNYQEEVSKEYQEDITKLKQDLFEANTKLTSTVNTANQLNKDNMDLKEIIKDLQNKLTQVATNNQPFNIYTNDKK